MFWWLDKTTTKHRQVLDDTRIGEGVEGEIKKCQRENGAWCMKSTSDRLWKAYGGKPVDILLPRLSQRRYRGNKYQEKETTKA